MKALVSALGLLLTPLMALAQPSPTLLTNGAAESAAPYTTASVTANANTLVLLNFTGANSAGLTVTDPTITGTLGGSWTKTAGFIDDSGSGTARSIYVYCAVFTSGATGTLIMNFTEAQLRGTWAVVSWTGTNQSSCANAVVQSAHAATTTLTSLTITLATFANPADRPYAFWRVSLSGAAIVAKTGWTDLPASYGGAVIATSEGEWINASSDVTPSITWTGVALGQGIAIEIKTATAPDIIGGGLGPGCVGC